MAAQASFVSTAINLMSLGLYHYYQSEISSQNIPFSYTNGVALASILHSTRPYSEQYLKRQFNKDYKLDILYTAFSLGLMGGAGVYAQLPTKINILSACIFAGVQLASTKIAKACSLSITSEELAEYRTNSYKSEFYLTQQLFPKSNKVLQNAVEYSPYLYMFPQGFMVILCANGNHPFFLHLPAVDGTEVKRMKRIEGWTLPLSQETHQQIQQLAKKVKLKELDGTESKKEWILNEVPPLICIEGMWNQEPELYGTTIHWDSLIQKNLVQKHEAFELRLIQPIWNHLPQNPTLKGMKHLQSRGVILWIHKKNENTLGKEQEAVQPEIQNLQAKVAFIKKFEKAFFKFNATTGLPQTHQGNDIDFTTLKDWANLAQDIPFCLEEKSYKDLPQLVREFGGDRTPAKEKALFDRLTDFFQNLPWKAHLRIDYTLYEQFTIAKEDFYKANNDVIRTNGGYIDTDKLKNWLTLLKKISLYCEADSELEALIKDVEDYIDTNEKLCSRSLDLSQTLALRQKRDNLVPLLKEGFSAFFNHYQQVISDKGKFVLDLKQDIDLLKDKQGALLFIPFAREVE